MANPPDISRVTINSDDIKGIIGLDIVHPEITALAMYEYDGQVVYVGENKGSACIFWFPMVEGIGSRSVESRHLIRVMIANRMPPKLLIQNIARDEEKFCESIVKEMISQETMEDVETLNAAGSNTPMQGYAFVVDSVE